MGALILMRTVWLWRYVAATLGPNCLIDPAAGPARGAPKAVRKDALFPAGYGAQLQARPDALPNEKCDDCAHPGQNASSAACSNR